MNDSTRPEDAREDSGHDASTRDASARDRVEAAATKTPDPDPERRWLAEVYRGGGRQLTVRAVVSGMLIGMIMCLSNLYVVLKTGWSIGVTITACILAWAVFHGLKVLRLTRAEFTTLENNAMGSVASAAGYMTGGGNMAALPALLMLTGARPDGGWLIAWFATIAALGVFVAIPIKRQLVNIEALPFPTGTATAETLRALHGRGADAVQKARRLAAASGLGALVAFFRDAKIAGLPSIPSHVGLPFLKIAGLEAKKWTLAFEGSVLMLGAGALMSFRTGWSLLLGGVVLYGGLAPWMVSQGVIAEAAYRPIVQWSLWTGAAILVSSGLLSFAFQWRMVARSFLELGALLRGKKRSDDPLADVECPGSWFVLGMLALGPVIVFLMHRLFDIPIWAGLLSLPLAVVMGMVAARVTGETDVTPTKALGPVTQLTYGALLPGNITANVMSANVTGGVGLHAADLLVDLKSGFLLGANPRQQLYAQLFGCVAGALILVPAFNLLVPSAEVLGSEAWPAPGAQVWAGVSKVLSVGISALHPSARMGAMIGALLGILLTLAERYLPAKLRAFVPAPSGLGIAFVIPGYNSIMMFLGALGAELLRRRRGKAADDVLLPVSAGLIAGESLMGILIAFLVATGLMPK